ncbi:MAG: DUF4270 family protein [Flavobacterium sp.]|uniref:DUF4270 family protein n=1 Tax=Flavobacterium sp. TaxID=239 RepID=UPI00261B0BA4|nr:DUF4270 family protein [Flavobacterium sp.]MDD5149237.1 DUF4270 family protein [Flavobacterium sp.]
MRYILFLLLFITIFTSCQTDNTEGNFVVGSDYLSINNKVIMIDTLTVDVSTINFDSLATSNQGRILIGNYNDPILGKVKSESYFKLTPDTYYISSSSSDTQTTNYVFDSIAVILRYDRYYYGDTTKTQTINIHQLTQSVKPNIDDTNFYNISSLTYDSKSIGSKTFYPKPIGKDSINIQIDPDFGKKLFDKLNNNEITNSNEFDDYFKGLVIKPSTDNSANLIGYTTKSVLRLYYKISNTDSKYSLIKDFSISDITKQFNTISLDRTGTILQNLPDSRNKLASELTDNNAYIQSGTGLACRIDFPFIKQLKYISEKGFIVDAELVIKPNKNSISTLYPLKDSLQVYECDNLNRISKVLTNSDGSKNLAILNNIPDEFNENIGYKINLGSFLSQEISKIYGSKSSLIFAFPNISKGVDRIVLGNQKNTENKLKLKIYYISY